MRYIGSRTASHIYQINGRRYVFGNNPTHKVIQVYQNDIEPLFVGNPGLFEKV